MYQLNHKIYKPYREVLNTSYFTEYIEDENSKYNTGLMNTASLFEETDTTISKMVFIDDTNHQIIIEGCHIETKSVLLKNLKYSLVKMKLMGNKDFVEKDNVLIKQLLGINGLFLKQELLGFTASAVENEVSAPKSVQDTKSFDDFTNNFDFLINALNEHVHNACKKMRQWNGFCSEIEVILRTKDFKQINRIGNKILEEDKISTLAFTDLFTYNV